MELKKGKIGICLFLLLIFIPFHVTAAEWWETKQKSSSVDEIHINKSVLHDGISGASRTNWEDGYIEVMAGATADPEDIINLAHAYSLALKTARHLAYEKLAETVSGLNLYSDSTYDRELMIDSNLRTVLRAMIRNARVVNEEKSQFADGSVWAQVTLGMMLFGEEGLIKPSVAWQERQSVPKPDVIPLPDTINVEEATTTEETIEVKNEEIKADEIKKYSGLIIDARGIKANPAMLPKILSSKGEIIYGKGDYSKDYLIKFGLMGYQKDITGAKTLKRVGSEPLIVKAVSTKGKNRCDFVLSEKDTELLKLAASINSFLKECRVVAVLD